MALTSFALDADEAQRQLCALMTSLQDEGHGPSSTLNELMLAGHLPEALLGPACTLWKDPLSRTAALLRLAAAALEPEPMREALCAQGYPDLAARTLLLLRHPEWRGALMPGWPADGPTMTHDDVAVTFRDHHYRLPRGPFAMKELVLEGGPVAPQGIHVEHELTLRDLRRPLRLGPVRTDQLTLEGRSPLPRKRQIQSLRLQGSRLPRLPRLGPLERLELREASLRHLGRHTEAMAWVVTGCPNLRGLPRDWVGTLVLLQGCRRLRSIPRPGAPPHHLLLQDLPSLRHLGRALTAWQLTLERCGIRELPPRLHVLGNLTLRDCPDLHRLGAGTVVEGDLVLSGLPRLRHLPPDLVVRGTMRWA